MYFFILFFLVFFSSLLAFYCLVAEWFLSSGRSRWMKEKETAL